MTNPPQAIGENSLAVIDFEVTWKSGEVAHRDRLACQKVNFWRDILPGGLAEALHGKTAGDCETISYAPGELVTHYDEGKIREIKRTHFDGRGPAGHRIAPDCGRFFPLGMLTSAVPGIFKADMRPFRCVGGDGGILRVDLNHPLSGVAARVKAEVREVMRLGDDLGGRCTDWAQSLTDGPGLQARWRGRPTEFFQDGAFARADESADGAFYAQPRMTVHLDSRALGGVAELYGRILPRGSRVLDLMSSWKSHLPGDLEPACVTGLGLNRDEMAQNEQLSAAVVYDLNLEPRLPFGDGCFDAAVCTVSVEYLTRPVEVFAEVARVLRPGAPFAVTFSHRWFPPKVVKLWTEIHPFERMGFVLECFHRSGLFERLETVSLRGLPRPEKDAYFPDEQLSDPVFAVWGRRH
ncbi:MAG: methyltransferase domain-containing protein [Rhodospirillales bacterium]|nr:methyltransferase domain-containing protein [Rhodospirillales bacterium]